MKIPKHSCRCRYAGAEPGDPALPLRIHRAGCDEWMMPGIVDRPNGTGDWLLMFFASGTVLRDCDGREFACSGESAVLWPPGAPHYYGNRETSWCHSWTHFDGLGLMELAERYALPFNTPIPAPYAAGVRHLEYLCSECLLNPEPSPVIGRNILENLFVELRRSKRERLVVPPGLMMVKAYLEQNFTGHAELARLSRMAAMSAPHFSAEFRRCFGAAPIAYRCELRMRHAAWLLTDRNLSIAEAARRCGFDDPFYFSRRFRRRYGVSPAAYRRGGAV